VRTDHRPYWLRKAHDQFQLKWQRHFLEPLFESCGEGLEATLPWKTEVYGPNIWLGNHIHIKNASSNITHFCTWPDENQKRGRIEIGDYVLITPGVRLLAARSISIGDNVMLASDVLVSDSDWHGIYDRTKPPGKGGPITICDNVWIGQRAIICKNVTIGENSIIGAGSIVTKDIPANCIAAGNPAKVVRELDHNEALTTRADMFADPEELERTTQTLYKWIMKDNTLLGWIRAKLWPTTKD
jgi:acetyltransferase-like isoleucine patch superfamily enzyme